MNICFLIGRIISNIEYEFILNSKNISIVKFKIEVENNKIIIKAYNEMADWCYQNLKQGNIIGIEGSLNSKLEVVINEILKN